MLVELSSESVSACRKNLEPDKLTPREDLIMRKYMIIALKNITKVIYCKGLALS